MTDLYFLSGKLLTINCTILNRHFIFRYLSSIFKVGNNPLKAVALRNYKVTAQIEYHS
jgi:hypothetical protein